MSSYCRFRTYPDSDDPYDLLIGYPAFSAVGCAADAAPAPVLTPLSARPLAEWSAAERREFTALARRLGADGKWFTARQVATGSGCSAKQAAAAFTALGIAEFAAGDYHVRYWRLRE
jgi:hypothetical protein